MKRRGRTVRTLRGTVSLSPGTTTTCHVLKCYRVRLGGGGRTYTGFTGTGRLNSRIMSKLVRGCYGWCQRTPSRVHRSYCVVSRVLLRSSQVFTAEFRRAFPIVRRGTKGGGVLLVFRLPCGRCPFHVFHRPRAIVTALSCRPCGPIY